MKLLRYEYDGEAASYLNCASHLFKSLADRGLMGITAILESGIINEENNAIVFLLRNAIAYIDAMSCSANIPSVESLKILVRSFFEVKCYCEYICKENTNNRAIAYQVFYLRERIKKYKRYDLDTSDGIAFEKKVKKDKLFSEMGFPFVDTKSSVKNLEKQLKRKPYNEMNGYFELNPKKEWYSFDIKKNNFCDLCDYLNCQIGYEYFYRQWSETAHSSSTYAGNIVSINKKGGIDAIRSLEGYHDLIMITYSYIIQFYLEIFNKLVPDYYIRTLHYYKNQYKKNIEEIEKAKNLTTAST